MVRCCAFVSSMDPVPFKVSIRSTPRLKSVLIVTCHTSKLSDIMNTAVGMPSSQTSANMEREALIPGVISLSGIHPALSVRHSSWGFGLKSAAFRDSDGASTATRDCISG